MRIAYRVGLVVVGVALYAFGNSLWVVCALLLAWLFLQQQIAALVGVVGKLESVPQEHDANCVLQYTFGLEAVLAHPSVDELFNKLLANGKAPAETLDAWRNLLLESYARKYATATKACDVTFNIKNNLLFKNREVDFGDHIFHSLEIPYRWTGDGKPEERKGFMSPEVEVQLTIRMLVVNGALLLQVGDFNKAYSPRILHGGSLAVYETHATVASFPLLYFAADHGIPVRYLNLVSEATNSQKEHHALRGDETQKADQWADWRVLQKDIAAYRVLCDTANESHDYDVVSKLAKSFDDKRAPLLAGGGYQTYQRDDEDAWRYPDIGHSYWNEFGTVFFRNMNANRDSHKTAHWFTDYYEERP